jgi:HAMP domain-containing protein
MVQTASNLHNRTHQAIMPGIVAIASSLIFVLIFNYFINYYVIKPINFLVREVRNNIKTKGTIEIEIDSKDELHDLATAIKEFAAERQR